LWFAHILTEISWLPQGNFWLQMLPAAMRQRAVATPPPSEGGIGCDMIITFPLSRGKTLLATLNWWMTGSG